MDGESVQFPPARPTPPWGSPQPASPSGYEPGPAQAPSAQAPSAQANETGTDALGGTFHVVIEQSVGNGESIRWAPEPLLPAAWPTRDAARAAAVEMCRDLQPTHPYSPRRRMVLEITADEYLVVVEGMTKTFHFRVSVARLIS